MEKEQVEKTNYFNRKKAELRKHILSSRNALLPEQRQVWDRQILNRLIRYDRENPCPVYLCYVSYKSEVSTKEFILWCLKNSKIVFVPKVIPYKAEKSEEKDMEFFRISVWDELKTGYQGILEPESLAENSFFRWIKKTELTAHNEIEITTETAGTQITEPELTSEKSGNPHFRMLLPGAVFDTSGNRIGYGGGFYDRWLAKWNCFEKNNSGELEKIGLAYKMQIVNRIPAESFDQKVDRVITENEEEKYESGITL